MAIFWYHAIFWRLRRRCDAKQMPPMGTHVALQECRNVDVLNHDDVVLILNNAGWNTLAAPKSRIGSTSELELTSSHSTSVSAPRLLFCLPCCPWDILPGWVHIYSRVKSQGVSEWDDKIRGVTIYIRCCSWNCANRISSVHVYMILLEWGAPTFAIHIGKSWQDQIGGVVWYKWDKEGGLSGCPMIKGLSRWTGGILMRFDGCCQWHLGVRLGIEKRAGNPWRRAIRVLNLIDTKNCQDRRGRCPTHPDYDYIILCRNKMILKDNYLPKRAWYVWPQWE